MNRPIFYFNNDPKLEIKAGGLLLYRFNKNINNFELLMINKNNVYEDFGGKTDCLDKNIHDTIIREVIEESNGLLNKSFLNKVINKSNSIYKNKSKYLLLIAKTNEYFDPNEFGKCEIEKNISRKVEWIPVGKILSNSIKIHIRLRFYDFFKALKLLS